MFLANSTNDLCCRVVGVLGVLISMMAACLFCGKPRRLFLVCFGRDALHLMNAFGGCGVTGSVRHCENCCAVDCTLHNSEISRLKSIDAL